MPFPIKGTAEITKNNDKAILDYGNADCDDIATMTINGVATEIRLKNNAIF